MSEATRSKLAIVIPCYNEASRLNATVFKDFLARTDSVHLIFVDDGSSDETAEVLRQIHASREEFSSVLVLPENVGKAGGNTEQGLALLAEYAAEARIIVLAPESRKSPGTSSPTHNMAPTSASLTTVFNESFPGIRSIRLALRWEVSRMVLRMPSRLG